MQHNIIIMCIMVVTMLIPVTGPIVNLHIAYPQRAAYLHLGIEEVGAGIAVVQSWVNHLDRPSVGGL